MTGAELLLGADVSRETLDRLNIYAGLIAKWNPAINLVSKKSLAELWPRHFRDSAQVFGLVPPGAATLADLGSGAGFPGMVIAILAAGHTRPLRVTLVESDQRKAAFLATVSRETSVPVTVCPGRIEGIAPLGADVLTARALAPLDRLIQYARRHLAPSGRALFAKGAQHQEELDRALAESRFSYDKVASATEPGAVIYRIWGISNG